MLMHRDLNTDRRFGKFDMLETKMCVKINVYFEINQFLPRNFYPPQYEQYIIVINHHADDMNVVEFVILTRSFTKKNFSYIRLSLHARIFITVSMHSHFVSRFPSFVLNKNQYLPAEAPF